MREVLALFLTLSVFGSLSADVPVTDAPKQSHHALFIEVCGELELVILTTNPPLMVTRGQDASYYFMELLRNTPQERVIRLKHWDNFCPKKT